MSAKVDWLCAFLNPCAFVYVFLTKNFNNFFFINISITIVTIHLALMTAIVKMALKKKTFQFVQISTNACKRIFAPKITRNVSIK